MGQCEDDIKIPFPVVHSVLIIKAYSWSTDLDGVIPDVVFTLQLYLFASNLLLNQSEYTAEYSLF